MLSGWSKITYINKFQMAIINISKAKCLEWKPVRRIESLLLRFVPSLGYNTTGLKVDYKGKQGDEMSLSLTELPRGDRSHRNVGQVLQQPFLNHQSTGNSPGRPGHSRVCRL